VMDGIDEHSKKQEFSMEVIGVGIVMNVNDENQEKQEFSMKVI
jgi:hypothetical protein